MVMNNYNNYLYYYYYYYYYYFYYYHYHSYLSLVEEEVATAVTAVVTLIFYFIFMYRWALQKGYGAKLINNPELIKDIVRKTTCRIPGLPVSIKIRIHENLR